MAAVSNEYSASEIIGKQLITAKPTLILRLPFDNLKAAQPIREVPAGTDLGTVFSYLAPNKDRSAYYWQFDNKGLKYYVKHLPGQFNIKSLITQGAKDVATVAAEKKEAEKSTLQRVLEVLERVAIFGIMAAGTIYVIKTKKAGK